MEDITKHGGHHTEHERSSTSDHTEAKRDYHGHLDSTTAGGIGGFEADLDDVPKGYFTSRYFLGSFLAIVLAFNAGVGAFVSPSTLSLSPSLSKASLRKHGCTYTRSKGFAAPILGQINAAVGPDPRYPWISLVYNASLAVCIAPLGRITDIFGRRWWFIGSGVLSVVGSVVCAQANSIPTLIGGNVFLGIGTAAQLSFHYVLG
jgi:MFS family permease